MKPTPKGWPRISASIFYDDPQRAIDWLCNTFGFEVRLKVEGEGGTIEHSELEFGDGLIMVGPSGKVTDRETRGFAESPASNGGKCTQALAVFVDDVDAHCDQARAAGAKIEMAPETHDYGDDYWTDRSCQIKDLEGHQWWFLQRLRG